MENQSEKESVFKRIKGKITSMPKAYWMIACLVVVIFVVVGLVFGVQNKSFNLKKESFKIVDVKKKTSGNYIDLNETFLIETRRGSLEEVQKHIYVEPPVNYEIKRVSVNQYELIAKDIPSDTLVNVSYVDNKVVENKWAFQSTKDFKVTSIYPTNGASDVSVNTGIEITFSYPNISEINNYVEIVPAVEGSFTCSGRTCIFKAKDRFEYGTIYTIKVKPGVYSGDYHLEEEVQSSFSTLKADSSSGSVAFNSVFKGYNSITLDKISTFRPTDNPMFRTGYDSDEIVRVEVFKIKDAENFLKCLNQLEYTSTSLGEVAIHSVDDNGLYALDKTLEKGYYIFQGYDNAGILSFTMPVQIHELSTYVLNTQSDFLVWVGSDNSLLKDIPVTYEGKTIKTDKEGIAYFKDFNTADGDMKYIAVGKDNPLYVGVSASSRNQYADAYIYTDRPLYKNTDEIKVWGFIPFKYYAEWEDFSKDQFVLSFDDNNIPIKINDDGTFITNYSLNNYKDGTYYFDLKYKNVVIDSRYVQVLQYEKENYLFNINKGTGYVRAGDKYHFEVAVKHISGIMVPNKEIKATIDKKEYIAVTNSDGIAYFDVDTSRSDDSSNMHMDSVHITSTLSEYAQKGYRFNYIVIDSYVKVDSFNYDTKNHSFSASIYNLDDKMKKIEGADGLYSGTVRIEINERVGHRSVSGSYYNNYTKKNYNTYSWTYETNTIERKTVTVKNGVIKHKTDYSFKESTDDTSYSYYFNIFITDRFGNDYYYDTYFTALENNDYRREGYLGDAGIFYDGDASLFEYYFVPEKVSTYSYKKYHVGDSIPRELNHYSGSKEDDGNTLLLIKYKNHILDREVISYKDGLSIRFDDKDRPGIDTTSAYFKNGVFHRMPIQYIDYDENDSKLDIAVNTNAKNYQPKDKVTAKIKVTQNGKGKKAKILVSVVDEAVFNNTDDHTDILKNLYWNETYRGYLYSSYRNYMLHTDGGGGGAAAGEERSDF